jgi:DNA-binding NtrC family response regulator
MQVASEAHRLPLPELAACAREALLNYSWPGNVRELKNVTERLVLRDARRPITTSDLPHDVHSGERRDTRSSTFGVPQAYAPSHQVVASTPMAERLWEELATGQDFWNVVHRRFRVRELTRADLSALIDRGLKQTLGSYRALLALFNLPPGDYKRFHAFLYQQKCNLPVRRYRNAALERPLRSAGSGGYRAVS